jgi:hypothetical protein
MSATIYTDRQSATSAANTARERIVALLESRKARIIDRAGVLAPTLILCHYRCQGITLAVVGEGEPPTERQQQVIQIAWDGDWYGKAVDRPEQVEALLDAIDYQKETGR